MRRIALEAVSATKTCDSFAAMPLEFQNCAFVPVPSVSAGVPFPAKRLATPPGVTRHTVCTSLKYTKPVVGVTAMPETGSDTAPKPAGVTSVETTCARAAPHRSAQHAARAASIRGARRKRSCNVRLLRARARHRARVGIGSSSDESFAEWKRAVASQAVLARDAAALTAISSLAARWCQVVRGERLPPPCRRLSSFLTMSHALRLTQLHTSITSYIKITGRGRAGSSARS